VLQKAYKHEEWVLNQAWKYIWKAATLQKNRSRNKSDADDD